MENETVPSANKRKRGYNKGSVEMENQILDDDNYIILKNYGNNFTKSLTLGQVKGILEKSKTVKSINNTLNRQGLNHKEITIVNDYLNKINFLPEKSNQQDTCKRAKQIKNNEKCEPKVIQLQHTAITPTNNKHNIEDQSITPDDIMYIFKYLSFADTGKDFNNIDDTIFESLGQPNFTDLYKYFRKRIDENKDHKYVQLFNIIAPINSKKLNVKGNKIQIFDNIFKNNINIKRKYPTDKETQVHLSDFTKTDQNYDNSKKIEMIDDSYHIYELILGNSTQSTGIFDNSIENEPIKEGRQESESIVYINNSSANILKRIFGDSKFIVNSGIKESGKELDKNKRVSLAKIFDLNMKNIQTIIETNETEYMISKQNNELNYIENIFAIQRALYMNRDAKQYLLINNESRIQYIQDCPLKGIKTNLIHCLKVTYEKRLPERDIKKIILCLTNKIVKKLLCCLNAEDLLTQDRDLKIIQFLTDLKRTGDFATARSALATDAVFLTGDYLAAAYAIFIGCKTVLSVKKDDNYKYYIYNPKPRQPREPQQPQQPQHPQQPQQRQGSQERKSNSLLKQTFEENCMKTFKIIQYRYEKYDITFEEKIYQERELLDHCNFPNKTIVEEATKIVANIVSTTPSTSVHSRQLLTENTGDQMRDQSSSGGKTHKTRKMKGGAITNEKFQKIAIEYLYEKSLENGKDYLQELIIEINNKKNTTSKEFILNINLVDHMNEYLEDIHILKYGYSTPLQYTVLRFLELSNIQYENEPFTMKQYTTMIREYVKYMEEQEYQQTELLKNTVPYITPSMTFQTQSVPVNGGDPSNKITKPVIDEYEKKLASLYKKYIKLAESNKTEQELSKEFEKLDMGIQKLSAKIKKTMEKEIKK